ncbi:uncharacterized protein LOC120346507 [Styela clava]
MNFRALFMIFIMLSTNFKELVESKRGKRGDGKGGRKGRQVLVEPVMNENTLRCPSCEKLHCPKRNPKKLNCKGGITTDVCGCCPRCAKLDGESCGGQHEYLGKCDRGLLCEPEPLTPHITMRTSAPSIEMSSTTTTMKDGWKGRCRAMDKVTVDTDPREGLPKSESCQPECSADFCLENPKAICSARNALIESQDCQGDCQHTACSACFFQEEPPCPKCGTNDFSCIKKFAKCTKKKTTCKRNKFPCKKQKKAQEGKFLCWVPKCLV